MISCSVIVPVHNEGDQLEGLFAQFWDSLGLLKKNVVEIHLIENGSSDNTFELCKKMENMGRGVIFAEQIPIASYGEAIKAGIVNSNGEAVCVLECDALDICFLSESLAILNRNEADLVIASKRHPDSIDLRPIKRRIFTYLFNLFIKICFNYPGSDTHGLKTIRTDVAKLLCENSITGGEVFQTEIVLLAHRMGFKIKEVPIRIEEKRATKISPFRRLPKVARIIRDLSISLSRF